jgi:hypothetical protein
LPHSRDRLAFCAAELRWSHIDLMTRYRESIEGTLHSQAWFLLRIGE